MDRPQVVMVAPESVVGVPPGMSVLWREPSNPGFSGGLGAQTSRVAGGTGTSTL